MNPLHPAHPCSQGDRTSATSRAPSLADITKRDRRGSGIGFENAGEIYAAARTVGHKVVRDIGHGIRDTTGLPTAQPGGVLDVHRPADARAEEVNGIYPSNLGY